MAAAAGFVLVVLIACGGSSAPTQPQGSSAATGLPSLATPVRGPAAAEACTTAAADGVQVAIPAIAFEPAEITVPVGTTVTWTNTGTLNHIVTFNSGPDCGLVLIGKSVVIQFNTPGTFEYFCQIHIQYGMRGKVNVE